MSQISLQNLLCKIGLGEWFARKRLPKARNGWGNETEQLENRALLSAARCDMSDPGTSAHVARVERKAAVQFPAINGTWNVTVEGQFSGSGTVIITQSGKKINAQVSLEGLPQFEAKGTLKAKTPFTLNYKTPKLEIPGFPAVSLTLTINFPAGNLSPSTFTGNVKAPVVGTVASLSAIKAPN